MASSSNFSSTETGEISVEKMQFSLTAKELFGYLKSIRPEGYQCPVCLTNKWGVAQSAVEDADGVKIQRIFPDESHPSEFSKNASAADRVLKNASRKYSFICLNCAHIISFNAGMVAARIAHSKQEKAE
ncbi:hypothetical protein [Variovorax paradoxus]|uniref:hypothetical protein n=1 Tax=Variovorax paradoxus TaxID=34073 RepID=UPI001ABC6468